MCAWWLVPWLCALAGTGLAAENWQRVESPEVIVLTDGRAAEAHRFAVEFATFRRQFTSLVLGGDSRPLPPTVVLLFRHDRSFHRFKPAEAGDRYAGVFARFDDRSVVALSHEHSEPARRAIAFHEGVHWLLDQHDCNPPLWLNEGLAEVFSTFTIADGRYSVGQPVAAHLALLQETPPWPLARLFATDRNSPAYLQQHSVGQFYAQSWAIAHLMLFGESNHIFRRDAGARETLLRGSAAEVERLVEDRLGGTPESAARAIQEYVVSGRCVSFTAPLVPAEPKEFRIGPAPAGEVELALGMLLVGTGRLAEAAEQFRAAESALPRDPRPHEGLAVVASRRQSPAETIRHYARAVELGSLNPYAQIALAQEATRHHARVANPPGSDPRATAWVAAFRTVIGRGSRQADNYLGLAKALYLAPECAATDVAVVEHAAARFPEQAELRYDLALLRMRTGDMAAAGRLWEGLAADPQASTEVRRMALEAMDQQRAAGVLAEARAAIEAEKHAEAESRLALLDVALLPHAMAESVVALRRVARDSRILQEARGELAAAEFERARKLLQDLLADPALDVSPREEARRLLDLVAKAQRDQTYVARYNAAIDQLRGHRLREGVAVIEGIATDPEAPDWLRQRAGETREQIRVQTGQ